MSFYDNWDYNVEVMDSDVSGQSVPVEHLCPQCGAKMRPYEQYCHRCCSWIGRLCPHCHMPVKDEKQCVYCGYVLRQDISIKHTLILAALVVCVVGCVCVGYILSVPHAATAGDKVAETVTFVYDDPDSTIHVDASIFDESSEQYIIRASADKPMTELHKQLKAAGIDAAVTGSIWQNSKKGVDNYFVAIKDDEALFEPASKAIAEFYRGAEGLNDSFNITVFVTKDVPIEDVQEKMNTTVTLIAPGDVFSTPEYGHAGTSYRMYLENDDKNEQKLDARLLELFKRAHKQIN